MGIKEITSLQHPLVKHLVKLRSDKGHRKATGTVLIMGKKIVHEIAPLSKLKTVLIEPGTRLGPEIKAEEIYAVTPEILKKITGLQAPEAIAAEVYLPQPGNLTGKQYLLALDSINDPGNLGTILRTALALGWEGVFLTETSVDPFNDKAIRAAKGATFQLPIAYGSREDLIELTQKNKLHVYLADAKGTSLEKISIKTPLLLILGSESHGISAQLKKQFEAISIPISPKMESLNVAVAGAILMYKIKHS